MWTHHTSEDPVPVTGILKPQMLDRLSVISQAAATDVGLEDKYNDLQGHEEPDVFIAKTQLLQARNVDEFDYDQGSSKTFIVEAEGMTWVYYKVPIDVDDDDGTDYVDVDVDVDDDGNDYVDDNDYDDDDGAKVA